MPKHLIPIVATVFVLLFVWLSMAPLLSWYEFGGHADELDEASLKWRNSGITDYSYVYEISSYFAPPLPGAVRIVVRNSKPASVRLVDSGEAFDISTIPTVPGTINLSFEFITTLLAEYPYAIEVEYDVELGYPKKIMVDYSKSTEDEVTYFIKSFEVFLDDV